MKRKPFRALAFALLASLALTTFVLADFGPKPQLTVRVKNAPQEPYYLDLLAEGDWDKSDGRSNLSDEERAALDPAMLTLLLDSVPAGWHACIAEGTDIPMWGDLLPESADENGNALHSFNYHGLPDVYRIIIVTRSGEVWISGTLEHKVLQSSATVNWRGAESSVSVPPVFIGYVLQFLATLLPTLIIEGVLLLIFQYSWKQNWKAFLLVNLATQGLLALFSTILTLGSGPTLFAYVFYLLPAELVVLLVEIYLYAGRRLLKGQSSKCAAVYAIFANLSSAILGYCIAEPVWRFVVSLS